MTPNGALPMDRRRGFCCRCPSGEFVRKCFASLFPHPEGSRERPASLLSHAERQTLGLLYTLAGRTALADYRVIMRTGGTTERIYLSLCGANRYRIASPSRYAASRFLASRWRRISLRASTHEKFLASRTPIGLKAVSSMMHRRPSSLNDPAPIMSVICSKTGPTGNTPNSPLT